MANFKHIKTYRVTAFYERPEVERNAIVQAESPQRAMVKALLERQVPAGFTRDEYGWILPVFWNPDMGGERRWPQIERGDRLTWGDNDERRNLRFEVEEL